MKTSLFVVLTLALCISSSSAFFGIDDDVLSKFISNMMAEPKRGSGGGMNCVICTFIVFQSQRYSDAHKVPIEDFLMKRLCPMFKQPLNTLCATFIKRLWGTDHQCSGK